MKFFIKTIKKFTRLAVDNPHSKKKADIIYW